jgi:hypothetical protein
MRFTRWRRVPAVMQITLVVNSSGCPDMLSGASFSSDLRAAFTPGTRKTHMLLAKQLKQSGQKKKTHNHKHFCETSSPDTQTNQMK